MHVIRSKGVKKPIGNVTFYRAQIRGVQKDLERMAKLSTFWSKMYRKTCLLVYARAAEWRVFGVLGGGYRSGRSACVCVCACVCVLCVCVMMFNDVMMMINDDDDGCNDDDQWCRLAFFIKNGVLKGDGPSLDLPPHPERHRKEPLSTNIHLYKNIYCTMHC